MLQDVEVGLLGRDDPPAEDGETYEANARLKAAWGRRHTSPEAWAVGEDSGIEAVALGGAPGVRTARWAAGEPVARMLEELADATDRGARYVCVLVAVAADGRELVARGALDGEIAARPSGDEGFGFDPVFVPVGETRTVADLGDAWKTEHSHRARAARGLAALL